MTNGARQPIIRGFRGDSRHVLRRFADNSFDSCVSDAPYALNAIVRRFGGPNAAPAKAGTVYGRASAGFMGQRWDTGETAFDPYFWAEVWRVLKPGAYIVVAGGARTYHHLALAVETAGFEIRDQILWLYGSGFPKSHNHEVDGELWGSALKPAHEPWVLARKPMIGTLAENLAAFGTGALNIDGCRVGQGAGGGRDGEASAGRRYTDRGASNFAAKPGPRGGDARGRWPANLVHDGSDEVVAAFPAAPGQLPPVGPQHGPRDSVNCYGDYGPRGDFAPRPEAGTAARFFYSAKATKADRAGSKHPTVKPIALMAWLCRLLTPAGGTVLDPFAGSGTTGAAALGEGFDCVLVEREADYFADIERRFGAFGLDGHRLEGAA